jgi:hypothetical protein
MRFRITIRGEGIELRGYVDGDPEDLDALARMCDPWLVVASVAPDDYDPFAISDPGDPPTRRQSLSLIQHMWDEDTASPEKFVSDVAMLHFAQAVVIRQERALREKAEAELRDRELHHFETEQENERLQKFAEYVMELHQAHQDGNCVRCERHFPCSENLMAKEALGV